MFSWFEDFIKYKATRRNHNPFVYLIFTYGQYLSSWQNTLICCLSVRDTVCLSQSDQLWGLLGWTGVGKMSIQYLDNSHFDSSWKIKETKQKQSRTNQVHQFTPEHQCRDFSAPQLDIWEDFFNRCVLYRSPVTQGAHIQLPFSMFIHAKKKILWPQLGNRLESCDKSWYKCKTWEEKASKCQVQLNC